MFKKLIRKSQNILPQLLHQLDKKDVFSINEKIKKSSTIHKFQHFNGPMVNGYKLCNQFKLYKSDHLFFSLSSGDNCVYIDKSVCVIKNIYVLDKSVYVACSNFDRKESFSNFPFDLKLLDMYLVSCLSDTVFVKSFSAIDFKFVLLPHSTELDCFLALPLLHNNFNALATELFYVYQRAQYIVLNFFVKWIKVLVQVQLLLTCMQLLSLLVQSL